VSSLGIAAIVFACCLAGGLLGVRSRVALPAHHLSEESKQLVQLCMGLIATMTALILGLVTASAKASFDAQDQALHAAAADLLMLDRALASFGPDTQEVRLEIREAIRERVDASWPAGRSPAEVPSAAGSKPLADPIVRGILALAPKDDAQRWQQSQALSIATDVLKTRFLSLTGASSPVSPPFLVVITFWLSVLFWSFGLFAPRNQTVIAVLLLSALSVAASVLLILEMQTPFSGLLRISDAPLRFALAQLGT
jgi:hypothetical protein